MIDDSSHGWFGSAVLENANVKGNNDEHLVSFDTCDLLRGIDSNAHLRVFNGYIIQSISLSCLTSTSAQESSRISRFASVDFVGVVQWTDAMTRMKEVTA